MSPRIIKHYIFPGLFGVMLALAGVSFLWAAVLIVFAAFWVNWPENTK